MYRRLHNIFFFASAMFLILIGALKLNITKHIVYITVDGQVLDNKIKQTEMRFVYEIISFLDVPYYIVYFVMSRHMVTSLLTRQADKQYSA